MITHTVSFLKGCEVILVVSGVFYTQDTIQLYWYSRYRQIPTQRTGVLCVTLQNLTPYLHKAHRFHPLYVRPSALLGFGGHRLCASWADMPGWVTRAASLQESTKGEGEIQGPAWKQSRSASLPTQHIVSLYAWSVPTSGTVFITSGCVITLLFSLKFTLFKLGYRHMSYPQQFLGALCLQTHCILVSTLCFFLFYN